MKYKIGAREYNVIFTDINDIFNENRDAYGYIDYEQSQIVIRKNVEDKFKNENLIHELLHALFNDARVDKILSHDKAELIVELLTPRIHQFIIDNKDKLISHINLN